MADTTITNTVEVTIKLDEDEAAKLTALLGHCFSDMLEDVYMSLVDNEHIDAKRYRIQTTEGGYIRVREKF